jgi:hypothetical protein
MVDKDDHHVNCWDLYSLHPANVEPPVDSGPLAVLFRVPVDKGHGQAVAQTVPISPGVDALNFYAASVAMEIWKNGNVVRCLAPRKLVGWEFYSLLWAQPDGTAPLSLGDSIEFLVGRPPGGQVSPSLLFAFIPRGHAAYAKADAHGRASSQTLEKDARNLDQRGNTRDARLVVLAPVGIYKDTASLPDDPLWGLYIGPRSKSLVLLNKQRGAVDLNLATLLTLDAVFWQGRHLIQAVSRLFDAFGTRDHVPALFGDVDPLKIHSAFTSATHAQHQSTTKDGRKDYALVFGDGARLPDFFVSNSSENLCYLTPLEAQRHRASSTGSAAESWSLPDMPRWTLLGTFGAEGAHALQTYRLHNPVSSTPPGVSQGWFPSLDGWFRCDSLTKASDDAHGNVGTRGQAIVQPVAAIPPHDFPQNGAHNVGAYGGTFSGAQVRFAQGGALGTEHGAPMPS